MVGSNAPSGSGTGIMILKVRFICLSPILSETDGEGLELVARVRAGRESSWVMSLRAGSLEVPMSLGGGA